MAGAASFPTDAVNPARFHDINSAYGRICRSGAPTGNQSQDSVGRNWSGCCDLIVFLDVHVFLDAGCVLPSPGTSAMKPTLPDSGATCSGVSPAPIPAPDLGSTRVPRTKQKKVSQTAGTRTPSGTGGGVGSSGRNSGGGSAPPGGSQKKTKKRKISSSSSSSANGKVGKVGKVGKRHNYPPVPSPDDCRWTRNMEQFEEARANEDRYKAPAPVPVPPSPMLVPPAMPVARPPPGLVTTYTAVVAGGARPPSGLVATYTAVAAGGAGGTAARLTRLRPWQWSKEECAAVARDAISSSSGLAGPGSAGAGPGADAAGLSLLMGAAGAPLFSDSDDGDEGEDEDAVSGDDREEEQAEEQQEEEEEEEGEQASTSNRRKGKGKGYGGTWPSSDSDGVGAAGGRGRARTSRSRKATGEPVEPRLGTSSTTAATVAPADATTPQDDQNYDGQIEEPPSSRTGRLRASPGDGGQHGQGREPGRPSSDDTVPPHPSSAVAVEAGVVNDEIKARELSAKLNRNSPRRVSPQAAQPGAIRPSAQRPVSATPASPPNTRIAASARGRPPAAKRTSTSNSNIDSNSNGGATQTSSGGKHKEKKKKKETKKKGKEPQSKKTVPGGAAGKKSSVAGEGGDEGAGVRAGAGDPWAESGLFFGVGTTAEVSNDFLVPQSCRFPICLLWKACFGKSPLSRGLQAVLQQYRVCRISNKSVSHLCAQC